MSLGTSKLVLDCTLVLVGERLYNVDKYQINMVDLFNRPDQDQSSLREDIGKIESSTQRSCQTSGLDARMA